VAVMPPAAVLYTTDNSQADDDAVASGRLAVVAIVLVVQAGRLNLVLNADSSAATFGLCWASTM
jgi:hypothetical protein